MKKLKNLKILTILLLVCSLFSFITPVEAAASATVGFDGNSTVAVGDTIEIKMYISNVTDTVGGIVSAGGNLSFDSNYLEYVSGTGITSPYTFQINTSASYKIAGLDTTLSNGITGSSKTVVFTFKFKALKEGTTQITLTNAKLSDTSQKITSNVVAKTITIGKQTPTLSSDATLKSLTASGYTLSPSFSSNVTSYSITVPAGTTSVTLNGTANHSGAKVEGLGNVTLTSDTTTKTVKVTAEDGKTTKTYTVKINREQVVTPDKDPSDSDATLKSLTASGYTLSPSFSSNVTSYTIKVPKDATTVKLEGEASQSSATVEGLGNITLTGDTTTAKVKVTAKDGTTKTYTVKFEKEKETENTVVKDSDATLKSLSVSGYTLSPTFNSATNTYSMNVKNSVTGLKVSAIPTSSTSTVSITGNTGWKEGINVISIKVTAEDGTVNTYTVNVNRESLNSVASTKSSDNYLTDLTIKSTNDIDKEFDKNLSVYNITVPYEVDKLDLSYTLSSKKANVTVVGNENFKVGEVSTVEIQVTAEDGSLRTYTLNVTRSPNESEAILEDLKIANYELSPTFNKDTTVYTITVPNNVDKLDISTKVPEGSTVEIIGNENLKAGKNNVWIKVTDKNGYSKLYKVEVNKEDSTVQTSTDSELTTMKMLLIALLIGLLFLLLFLLLYLLLGRKKEEKEKTNTPIIEVKPEFNFGSKNTSDDDIVHGNLNQNSSVLGAEKMKEIPQASYVEANFEEAPYDMYDETVTKEELIDAINEATRTKDPAKLKMLLEQEALNKKKKELKEKDLRNQEKDMDNWR